LTKLKRQALTSPLTKSNAVHVTVPLADQVAQLLPNGQLFKPCCAHDYHEHALQPLHAFGHLASLIRRPAILEGAGEHGAKIPL